MKRGVYVLSLPARPSIGDGDLFGMFSFASRANDIETDAWGIQTRFLLRMQSVTHRDVIMQPYGRTQLAGL